MCGAAPRGLRRGSSNSEAQSSTESTANPLTTTATLTPLPPAVGIHKIRHVVIIMQENRSFDSYFGTYPGADGIPGLAGNPGRCRASPTRRAAAACSPIHDRQDRNLGGPHSHETAVADIDGGAMDGFVGAAGAGNAELRADVQPGLRKRRRHAGRDGLPRRLATSRTTGPTRATSCSRTTCSSRTSSWSLPAHLYMVSEWSAICAVEGDPMSCRNAVQNPQDPPDYRTPPRRQRRPPIRTTRGPT